MDRQNFIQCYWLYYLELEKKFIHTLNYVEMSLENANTFSNEYAFLLQSIGAELDNFFKVYCGFSCDERKNISDYCRFILSDYPDIVNQKLVVLDKNMDLYPYGGWNISAPGQSLSFWDNFCKIKHSRYENIKSANQKSVLYALGALYLLEIKYLSKIVNPNEPDVPDIESKLFAMHNWYYRFIPIAKGFAIVDGKVCCVYEYDTSEH